MDLQSVQIVGLVMILSAMVPQCLAYVSAVKGAYRTAIPYFSIHFCGLAMGVLMFVLADQAGDPVEPMGVVWKLGLALGVLMELWTIGYFIASLVRSRKVTGPSSEQLAAYRHKLQQVPKAKRD